MRFSIIIPVYNVEKYLGKCLDSLLRQDFKSYEIIVVDDGTEDNSGKIADEYRLRNPEIFKVVHQENKGLGGARNTGIKVSEGDYLIFIDSDDYVADNFLYKVDSILRENEVDLLMYNICPVSEEGRIYETLFDWKERFKNVGIKEYINEEPSACNKVYKRWLFLDTGIRFPEHLLYEDLATIPMFAAVSPKIGRTKDALYFYLQRRNSIMRETDSKNILQIVTAMERVILFYKEKNLYLEYYAELEWLALRHVLCRSCGRLLIPVERTDWLAIDKLDSWMHENFPKFQQNPYYAETTEGKERDCMQDIIDKRYKQVQRKYYGRIRMKKRIKRALVKLKFLKD